MDDAHVRVFCKERHDSWGQFGHWYLSGSGGGVEYIRADVARKVKPLVWDKHPDNDEWYCKIPELESEQFERGFMILPRENGFVLFDGFGGLARKLGAGPDAGALKDLAQEIHERRIRSALVDPMQTPRDITLGGE